MPFHIYAYILASIVFTCTLAAVAAFQVMKRIFYRRHVNGVSTFDPIEISKRIVFLTHAQRATISSGAIILSILLLTAELTK